MIPLTGRTSYFYDNWESINASSQVLNIISGYEIPFVKEPYQYHHPITQANSYEERILIEEEINNLLAKDAIEEIPMSELYYSSSMFLVTKKSGGKRPVLNLKPLNKFVPNQTFKMEGIHLLKDFLKPNYFMTKLDLSDAYYSIPIDKHSRHYLQFIFEGKLYQFKVLVFGLNTAPRIFSECMKPVVAFIRSKGILIIIYLDDILLAARTYHECLCQTNFAIDLLESLGFCINCKKSQLIPSQHIPFLGFVVDSTTMTIGLPLEKIALIQSLAATLKESSQPVTLRSLSRFIGMCTATRPAVFQAPAHYRHLQFLKNSVLQNSLELNWVYNRKVSLNQAAKEDLVWWINHLSQNSTQPIILPSPNKIITTDSDGDMVRGRSFSRTLVRGRNKVTHKFKGTDGRFYESEVVCERSTLSDSHQSSGGQYDCLSLYKPFGWNRFCQSLHARSQNVEVVPKKKYPHFSCLHPRSTQLHSRNSVPINKSQFRMKTQSSNFSSDLCNLHYSRSRPFCNKSKQSSSEINFMVPRSRCSGNQCFLNSLVQPAMLCISPLQSTYEMPKKNSVQQSQGSPHCSGVEVETVVSNSTIDALRSPVVASQYFRSIDSSITSRENAPETSHIIHVAAVRRCLGQFKLSTRVSNIIMSSWRSGTQAQYKSAWSKWSSWCAEKQEDPVSCDISCFLEFLSELFDSGLQYRTISVYRSAISASHLSVEGSSIGSHQLVSRFMKGVYELRPPQPQVFTTWDVGTVLRYLKNFTQLELSH